MVVRVSIRDYIRAKVKGEGSTGPTGLIGTWQAAASDRQLSDEGLARPR